MGKSLRNIASEGACEAACEVLRMGSDMKIVGSVKVAGLQKIGFEESWQG